ncbi:MAG: KEOPS complex subunit Pcc1 [Candidatus Bathyarchaeia archaeon]
MHRATFVIPYHNHRLARAVAESVEPDNKTAPLGLRVKTEVSGSKLRASIRCGLKAETLIATLDDLLSGIQLAEKTTEGIVGG